MIFPSRKSGGPDPFLDWKVRFFFVGAVLALLGIGMKSSLLVGLALPVLLSGFLLRFLRRGSGDGIPVDDDGNPGESEGEKDGETS